MKKRSNKTTAMGILTGLALASQAEGVPPTLKVIGLAIACVGIIALGLVAADHGQDLDDDETDSVEPTTAKEPPPPPAKPAA